MIQIKKIFNLIKKKLSLIIGLASVLIMFGLNTSLFWLAIINLTIHIVFGFLHSYLVARPAMRKFRETLKEKYPQGATSEEIDEIEDFQVESEDYDAVSGWILGVAGITFLASIILLVAGLVMRFWG